MQSQPLEKLSEEYYAIAQDLEQQIAQKRDRLKLSGGFAADNGFLAQQLALLERQQREALETAARLKHYYRRTKEEDCP